MQMEVTYGTDNKYLIIPFFHFELSTFNFACLHVVTMGRSKSLENCKVDGKKDRRISWDLDDKTGQSGKKKNVEDKKRRHTVADMR